MMLESCKSDVQSRAQQKQALQCCLDEGMKVHISLRRPAPVGLWTSAS